MLKYQLIRTNNEHELFITLFEDSEEDKAWTIFDYEKMHKDTQFMILAEIDSANCTGKLLKSYKK